jgi:hypothetical protein
MPAADCCRCIQVPSLPPQSRLRDQRQLSRGKFDRLQRTTAGFTTSVLDGYGLRCHVPARPTPYASYPVLVHRLAPLFHASFRPRLATTPLRFANPSPPSGRVEDSHLQAVEHARHTKLTGSRRAARFISMCRSCADAARRGVLKGKKARGLATTRLHSGMDRL